MTPRRAARRHRRAQHAARRRRAGVPRAVGGAGFRDDAGAARARRCSPGPNGRRSSATRSRRRRRPAIPTPARPITGTGSPRWSSIVAEKGVTDAGTLRAYRDAWDHAADRTPHGKPIVLSAGRFPRLRFCTSSAAGICRARVTARPAHSDKYSGLLCLAASPRIGRVRSFCWRKSAESSSPSRGR